MHLFTFYVLLYNMYMWQLRESSRVLYFDFLSASSLSLFIVLEQPVCEVSICSNSQSHSSPRLDE